MENKGLNIDIEQIKQIVSFIWHNRERLIKCNGSQNEAVTTDYLVKPFLKAMGYDTYSFEVYPQYNCAL